MKSKNKTSETTRTFKILSEKLNENAKLNIDEMRHVRGGEGNDPVLPPPPPGGGGN